MDQPPRDGSAVAEVFPDFLDQPGEVVLVNAVATHHHPHHRIVQAIPRRAVRRASADLSSPHRFDRTPVRTYPIPFRGLPKHAKAGCCRAGLYLTFSVRQTPAPICELLHTAHEAVGFAGCTAPDPGQGRVATGIPSRARKLDPAAAGNANRNDFNSMAILPPPRTPIVLAAGPVAQGGGGSARRNEDVCKVR